jgi:hypothetical protein
VKKRVGDKERWMVFSGLFHAREQLHITQAGLRRVSMVGTPTTYKFFIVILGPDVSDSGERTSQNVLETKRER